MAQVYDVLPIMLLICRVPELRDCVSGLDCFGFFKSLYAYVQVREYPSGPMLC